MSTASRDAVQVYLNGQQLVHNKDYTFNSEGFCRVTATKAKGELIDIYEYETTNGSYVPPTPTKLGLYPSYQPELYMIILHKVKHRNHLPVNTNFTEQQEPTKKVPAN